MMHPFHINFSLTCDIILSTLSTVCAPFNWIIILYFKYYLEIHRIITPYVFFGCLCYLLLKPYSKKKLLKKYTRVSILDFLFLIIVTYA